MRGRRFWALAGRLDAMDLLLVVFLNFMLLVWLVPALEVSGVRAGCAGGVEKRVK
jgi:hypothetical protein